jgi:hypothetical protein
LIIEKLLVTPTERLKSTGDETLAVAYADALNRLFGLAPARPEAAETIPPGPAASPVTGPAPSSVERPAPGAVSGPVPSSVEGTVPRLAEESTPREQPAAPATAPRRTTDS